MTSTTIPQTDSLVTLSRQEAHLQNNLQSLLDAQSEGLLAGLTGPQDETCSTGSRTPTTDSGSRSSHKPKPIIPVRQPAKRKLGLRGARRGISRAISELADLKLQEARVLEDEVLQRDDVLSAVQSFERKSTGLQGHIRDIESEDTTRRVNELKGEEKTLHHEIHELETRLYEMKARQRHLLREIDGLNNSVQSKLSSYKSALALVEKNIKTFLARPPLHPTNHTAPAIGIWSLPRERRTLEMAKEHYTVEQQALRTRLSAVEEEKNALEDGAAVWEEVVQEVSTVEKALREEMQRIRPPLLETGSEQPAAEGMRDILQTMQKARSRIESKLDLAEAKNWKLLVCCTGAELEALVEGQGVLEGALEASEPGRGKGKRKMNGHGTAVTLLGEEGSDLEPADELLSMEGERERERSEDEDDGPGPELLISHHDDE
ncbi:hypothetical protein N7G274_007171 [Stereocaulon virgatum]|uniref:Uncharacterized protein n=1 Tax=Stereocaulon virgatum TaxID=373712 RepID=A0ABR4AA86_9LECA